MVNVYLEEKLARQRQEEELRRANNRYVVRTMEQPRYTRLPRAALFLMRALWSAVYPKL